MAAIPISISGVLYDKTARTQQPVYIIGTASIVGLSVGGGPIIPPEDAAPPGIWGPTDPRPTPPIAFPPGWVGGVPPGGPGGPGGPGDGKPPVIWPGPGDPDYPIGVPPGIWPNPPEGIAPHPEHPIVIPPPGNGGAPPLEVKVVWTEQSGWQVILLPTGPHPSPSR